MQKSYSANLFSIFLGLLMVCATPAAGFAARTGDLYPQPAPSGIPELRLLTDNRGYGPEGSGTVRLVFADDVTGAIVRQINRGTAECGRIDKVYRIDCMRQVYKQAAGATGNRRDYSAVNGELRKLSRTLNGIVGKNVDRKAGKIKVGNKSYRAVTRKALRQASGQASQAVSEAATKLLRSGGNAKKRKVHYTRIANAVNSSKKILRS
ncbi:MULTISPECIES: hypothetical protein [unclassified Roseibium]|uniref:hypothetical protein n=1 Tax=unclassified Roseibium TaxID=2629323 RepID=UPI0031749892